jgi:hypothetical protein
MKTFVAAGIALGVLVATAAHAADARYPVRPVRIIVPQSAGGSTDLVARAVAQKLGEALKENVIVENRPGAGSLHGTEAVAKSPPDGHTLLVVAASFTINPSLRKSLPFDPVRDFAPVSQLVTLPHILVVHPSLPVKSVKELVALAKAKPGELNFGSSGIATSTHLAAEPSPSARIRGSASQGSWISIAPDASPSSTRRGPGLPTTSRSIPTCPRSCASTPGKNQSCRTCRHGAAACPKSSTTCSPTCRSWS